MNFRPIAAALITLILVGCGSAEKTKDQELEELERIEGRANILGSVGDDPLAERRRQQRLAELDARQLYLRARSFLDGSDNNAAVEAYNDLSRRYPFSEYATQGEVERLYATYRLFEYERVLSGAERFLREHPRHPSIDYIYYLRGLAQFDREGTALAILPVDETRSDVSNQRRAFDDFALLLQRFPNSPYAGDARARMVHIRNRVAAHELHVVDFYIRRGAFIAAAKRAEQIVAQYPGTLASYRALLMMEESFRNSGLEEQAQETRRLIDGQDPVLVETAANTEISELGMMDVDHPGGPKNRRKKGFFAGLFGGSDDDEADAITDLPPPAVDIEAPAEDDVATKARKAEQAARQSDISSSAEPASDAPAGNALQVFIGSSEADDDGDTAPAQ